MHGDADLATPARLMGEPARAAMLVALLDGRSLPATELAAIAGVKPPTASAHLAQLVDGGLVVDRRLGRHRYFALAGPDVADAVEALQRIAPRRPVSSYRQSATAERLAEARSCYDHLAGRLALRLADALVAEGAIAPLEAGANGRILPGAADAGPLAARLRVGEVGPRRPAPRRARLPRLDRAPSARRGSPRRAPARRRARRGLGVARPRRSLAARHRERTGRPRRARLSSAG